MNQETVTLWLSIIGALAGLIGGGTGAVALVLHIKSHLRDRAILRLTAKMSMVWSREIPIDHLVLELNLVNEGRRIAHITKAGILILPTQSDADKTKGLPSPSEIQHNLFDGYYSGQNIALGENEAQIFRSEPFDLNVALRLGDKATAYVEDTTGKRLIAEFFVGTTPKDVQSKQQKLTKPSVAQ
ncbi:MAG: hypothetical protein PHR77_03970 [Kiritimatiellae bacterium]|nr:hypothetical protein [Kiritimatiellia bacterium]MDD5519940.1 hypothetical protein [Kiritimatiellia bacterium]